MKLLKFTIFTLAILVTVSAGVIYYTFSHIDEYVVDIIERVGGELTQTVVNIDRADIHLTQGSGALYNLSIGNPEGYSSNKLFVSNKIAFKVVMPSVNQPIKVIDKIDVRGIYFSVEKKGVKNNLQAMMSNIRSKMNARHASSIASDQDVEQPVETSIKAIVKRITFSEIQVNLYVNDSDVHSFKVPDFFVENIGDKHIGLSPKNLGRYIALRLMKTVNVTVEKELTMLLQTSGQKSAQDILGEQLLNTSPIEAD
jgi:hypothetical protein